MAYGAVLAIVAGAGLIGSLRSSKMLKEKGNEVSQDKENSYHNKNTDGSGKAYRSDLISRSLSRNTVLENNVQNHKDTFTQMYIWQY